MTFIFIFIVSDIPLVTRYYAEIYYNYEPTEGEGGASFVEASNNFNNFTPEQEENQKIRRIYDNFLASIDEDKYFAGSYWDGIPFVYDENGERVTDEKGKPLKRYDRDLYILVTDLKIVPSYLRTASPKLHFLEVRYSCSQLLGFINSIEDKFIPEGDINIDELQIYVINMDTINNRIEITASSDFDISEMPDEIPVDAYIIEYSDVPVFGETVEIYNTERSE